MKLLRIWTVAIAGLLFTQKSYAEQPSKSQLVAPLDRFIAAFNRWDARLPKDAFTDDCTVLDIFPPFQWSGPDAPVRWWKDLAGADRASHARKAALHEHLLRGRPNAIAVTASSANFNVPAVLTYVRNGAQHEIRGRWIINERLTDSGWRISAHAWATIASK